MLAENFTMTTVSKNLKRIREKNSKLSQTDMANLLNVKQSTYCNWESGLNDIKSEYLPKIAELLNVDIKDLFENQVAKIEITQNNSDNKDNSINGLVFVLSDKESLESLVTVLKSRMT